MRPMRISLPDDLRSFVDERVSAGGYGTRSEYVCELLRREQQRLRLRSLLLEGSNSASGDPVGADYFNALRGRI